MLGVPMGTMEETETVSIDVGGTVYTTTTATLKAIPHSKLAKLDKTSPDYDVKKQSYYFDRDADMFKHVLFAHRSGELHIPRDRCATVFRREMEFWEIPIRMLKPCCWSYAYAESGNLETYRTIQDELQVMPPLNRVHSGHDGSPTRKTFRAQLWLFLDNPNSSTGAKVWLFVYLAVVVVSAILLLIWLQPNLRVAPYMSTADCIERTQEEYGVNQTVAEWLLKVAFNDKLFGIACMDPHPVIFALDCFCMFVFAMELVLHCFASPDRLRFFYNRYNLMNLIQVVIMLIVLSLETQKHLFRIYDLGRFYFALKSISVCRLLLVIRINKVYRKMKLLTVAVERSGPDLRLLGVIFAMAALIFSGLIFNAEIESKVFSNTFYALWWAVITMTTVGYGDFYPSCVWGYIVGSLCAISGIIVISLPIASIASNFSVLHARSADIDQHDQAVKDEEKRDLEKRSDVG